ITGPDIISSGTCQATYTLANLPANATNPQWSCSQGLVKTADDGLNGAVFQRSAESNDPVFATVNFSFSLNGNSYTFSKNVQTSPIPVLHGVLDYQTHCLQGQGETGTLYYLEAALSHMPPALAYQWTITPPEHPNLSSYVAMFTGWSTIYQPHGFDRPGYHSIQLRIQDGCGWSRMTGHDFLVTGLPIYPFRYSFYPNPASSIIYCEINSEVVELCQQNVLQQQANNMQGQQNNCRVQMYSVMSGALVLDQQVVNFNSNFNVNVSNVPNGLYSLILLQGNEIIQQQNILIQH
ncbi:MAG: hypothetical protein FWH39_05750, partial [Bacteroidales bacterium]|nr:hypothetical protein [Bacteroidales bacterium]